MRCRGKRDIPAESRIPAGNVFEAECQEKSSAELRKEMVMFRGRILDALESCPVSGGGIPHPERVNECRFILSQAVNDIEDWRLSGRRADIESVLAEPGGGMSCTGSVCLSRILVELLTQRYENAGPADASTGAPSAEFRPPRGEYDGRHIYWMRDALEMPHTKRQRRIISAMEKVRNTACPVPSRRNREKDRAAEVGLRQDTLPVFSE